MLFLVSSSYSLNNSNNSASIPASDPSLAFGKLDWLQEGYELPSNTSMWSTVTLNYTGYVGTVLLPFNATADDLGATVTVACYANNQYRDGGSAEVQQSGQLWAMATTRPNSWIISFACSINTLLISGSKVTMLIVSSRPIVVLGTYNEGQSYLAPADAFASPPTSTPQATSQESFLIDIYGE